MASRAGTAKTRERTEFPWPTAPQFSHKRQVTYRTHSLCDWSSVAIYAPPGSWTEAAKFTVKRQPPNWTLHRRPLEDDGGRAAGPDGKTAKAGFAGTPFPSSKKFTTEDTENIAQQSRNPNVARPSRPCRSRAGGPCHKIFAPQQRASNECYTAALKSESAWRDRMGILRREGLTQTAVGRGRRCEFPDEREEQFPPSRPRWPGRGRQMKSCSSWVASLTLDTRRREKRNSRPERTPLTTAEISWMGPSTPRWTASAVVSTFSTRSVTI